MDKDNLSTPRQVKRLGLRRSNSMLKRSAKNLVECSAKSRALDVEHSNSSSKSKFPQSDIKIKYKDLEQNQCDKNTCDIQSTPNTPQNESSAVLQRLAVSTNCRPYRLALSKKIREKMTKKRLEFYVSNEIEKIETKEQQTGSPHHQILKTEEISNSRENLLDKIDSLQNELNARRDHLKKVEELKQAIFIWKNGFSSALHDLQQKIEPRLETSALLERLHISQKMIKYIDE